MRFLTFLLLAATSLAAQSLSIYSGNGQIVQEQFLTVTPLVVQAKDASGRPAAGVIVTWTITQGSGTIEGPPTTTTDANGQAGITFLATGVPPGMSYSSQTVTASSGGTSVNFALTTTLSRLPAGGFAAPPQGQLLAPTGPLSGSAGSTIPAGVKVLVIALSGAQAGQPVPNVGVRIVPNSDPALPSAACNAPAGTVLTDVHGIATCDLVLDPQPGTAQLYISVGETQTLPSVPLQVTPGVPCTYSIVPAVQGFAANGGAGSANVSTGAGCSWTASAGVPWIALSSNTGTGSGAVNYTVSMNTGSGRTGVLTVAGQSLTVSQSGVSGPQPLTITTASNLPTASVGAAYSTVLSASGGSGQYSWTLSGSLAPGLQLSSPGTISGVPVAAGTYAFNVSVSDTLSGVSQSQNFALVVVASSGQLTITNSGFPNGSVGQPYPASALTTTLGCSTPFSPVPSFRLTSGALPPGLAIQPTTNTYVIAGTPTATGIYQFSLVATDACGNMAAANFTITISGSQLPSALTVQPSALQFTITIGSSLPPNQSLLLTSASSVAYTAVVATSAGGNWLTVANPSGSTPATLGVNVVSTAQLALGSYTGTITITSVSGTNSVVIPVSLTVASAQNTLVVTPPVLVTTLPNAGNTVYQLALTVGSAGAPIQFSASAQTATGAWLSIAPVSGSTPALITAIINAAGLTPGTYSGSILVASGGGTQTIPVTLSVISGSFLSASASSITLSSTPGSVPATRTFTISSSPASVGFAAIASTTAGGNWLSVSPASGVTPASLNVTANTDGLTAGNYSGLISVQASDPLIPPVNIPVTLTVAPSAPSIASVTNGATFAPGPVAPGELIVIFGTQMGPRNLTSFLPDGSGVIAPLLAATRVLFDNIAAPIIYTSANQIATIAPYEVAGRVSTMMQVEYAGVLSTPLNIRVVDSSPAIFVIDSSGQGAIRNQDGTINSNLNAAAIGSVVSIYATGAGQTNPPGQDGQIIGSLPYPTPLLPVHVQIGGQDATILYAGAAPGFPSGILQVNARIPPGAPTGPQVPVVLLVGSQASPAVNMGAR